MQRTRLMLLTVGMALCLLASSCMKSGQEPNLHDRIMATHTSQYCRPPDACSNPHVLAVESGYNVTTFLGSKPQHAQVPTKDPTQEIGNGVFSFNFPFGSSSGVAGGSIPVGEPHASADHFWQRIPGG